MASDYRILVPERNAMVGGRGVYLPDMASRRAMARGLPEYRGLQVLHETAPDFLGDVRRAQGLYPDPVIEATDDVYYDRTECAGCTERDPDDDDTYCYTEAYPLVGQWWASSEGDGDPAHEIRHWANEGARQAWSLCGAKFEPWLWASGIQFTCGEVQHRGACILCRDMNLHRHTALNRSDGRMCRYGRRRCEVEELLWEFDRGIFR